MLMNGHAGLINSVIYNLVLINCVVMVFNLIPIPPLDGSKVLMGFLPYEQAIKLEAVSKYGIFIIFGLLLLGDILNFSFLGLLINPVANFFLRFMFI